MAIKERQRLVEQILHINARMRQLMSTGQVSGWLSLDLTMSQMKVLFLLYEGEMTMGQLAKPLGVTLSTVTGIVDRLVAEELVVRSESPVDRRQVIGHLTKNGRQLIERLYTTGQTMMANMLERLTLEDMRIVARALDVLYSAALAEEQALERKDRPSSTAGSSEPQSTLEEQDETS